MCLIHDIVEIEAGDTYAYDAESQLSKKEREDAAKEKIFSLLPDDQKKEFISLFDEFEEGMTAEAKFAKALDNVQPLMLNDSNGGSVWKEHKNTYAQIYGRHSGTKAGSETLFEYTEQVINRHVAEGNIIASE